MKPNASGDAKQHYIYLNNQKMGQPEQLPLRFFRFLQNSDVLCLGAFCAIRDVKLNFLAIS